MSFDAMSWAVKQKIKSSPKLVLLMLADRASKDTWLCYPSHDRLAEDCGMSKSSVKVQIAELASLGLIDVIHRSVDGLSQSNYYRLNAGSAGQNLTSVGQNLTDSRSESDCLMGQNLAYSRSESGYKPVIETIIPKQSDKHIPPQAAPGKPGKKVRTKIEDFPEDFQKAWAVCHPKSKERSGTADAFKAWESSGASKEPEKAIASIAAISKSHDWNKEDSKYAKGLGAWLRTGAWMSEIKSHGSQPLNSGISASMTGKNSDGSAVDYGENYK